MAPELSVGLAARVIVPWCAPVPGLGAGSEGGVASRKLATTLVAAVTVIPQVRPVVVSQPVKPLKTYPLPSGPAVSSTSGGTKTHTGGWLSSHSCTFE